MVVAALLVSAPASAQSDADRATARSLAEEGMQALAAKDYAKAADLFARADSLVPIATLKLGQARALVGQGKLVAAYELYHRIVRVGAAQDAPPVVREAVADARVELDALEPRMAAVVIDAQGAQVAIDGEPVPAAALGVRRLVDPGVHVVRATRRDGSAAEKQVSIAEGATVRVDFTEHASERAAATTASRDRGSETKPLSAPPLGTYLGLAGIGFGVGALGFGGGSLVIALTTDSTARGGVPLGEPL